MTEEERMKRVEEIYKQKTAQIKSSIKKIKEFNKCQKCGSKLSIMKYGMGYENDLYICSKCGHSHESNKSTWLDIDGTEHEVML